MSKEKIFKDVEMFIAVAFRGDEVDLIGGGMNRRLVEIQKDSFLRHNIDWSSEIQIVKIRVSPKTEPRVVLDDEQQPETGVNKKVPEEIIAPEANNGGDKIEDVHKEKIES